MIERVETVEEQRRTTIRLGALELVARRSGSTWHGSVYREGESYPLVSCHHAPDADAVFGELVAGLGVLAHAIGVALEAAEELSR